MRSHRDEGIAPSERLVWNTDDDNNNGIEDYLELNGPVTGEDDLFEIMLDPWFRDDAYQLDYRVFFQSSSYRLWDSATKDKEIIDNNGYLIAELPDSVFVEGTGSSSTTVRMWLVSDSPKPPSIGDENLDEVRFRSTANLTAYRPVVEPGAYDFGLLAVPNQWEEGEPTMIFVDEHHANDATYRRIGCQKRFVRLCASFAVERAIDRLPASLPPGSFGQAETVLAILARPAAATTLSLLPLRRQIAQCGVFAQATDDYHADKLQSTSQERPLGVAAIDDDPNRFSRRFQDGNDPLDPTGRQLQLGGKALPPPVLGNRRHRFLVNLKHGSQRQANRSPLRMPQCQRNRAPDMALQKWLIGRAECRAVMDVRPFDLRPVSLGGGVVDDQQHALWQRQRPQQKYHQLRGDRFGLASKSRKELIIGLKSSLTPAALSQIVTVRRPLANRIPAVSAGNQKIASCKMSRP